MGMHRVFVLLSAGNAIHGACALKWEGQQPYQKEEPHHAPTDLKSTDDHCKCLGWTEAYARLGDKCGIGHELFGDKYCGAFYQHFPIGLCMNFAVGYQPADFINGGQWCYVDEKCSKTQAIAFASSIKDGENSTSLAWKICNETGDNLLRTKTPEQLRDIAQVFDVDTGFLMKMAYPTIIGVPWEDVRKIIVPSKATEPANYSSQFLDHVREAFEQPSPVIFDSHEQMPLGIVQGKKVWTVEMNTANFNMLHPGTYTKMDRLQI